VTARIFVDSSVLVRGLSDDDPPRALAAARLLDGDSTLVLSTSVLIESVHALRAETREQNPRIANALIEVLTRDNVELVDAEIGAVVAALRWSLRGSARRIPDALIAAAAEQARCDWIVTFDEGFSSHTVPVRLI